MDHPPRSDSFRTLPRWKLHPSGGPRVGPVKPRVVTVLDANKHTGEEVSYVREKQNCKVVFVHTWSKNPTLFVGCSLLVLFLCLHTCKFMFHKVLHDAGKTVSVSLLLMSMKIGPEPIQNCIMLASIANSGSGKVRMLSRERPRIETYKLGSINPPLVRPESSSDASGPLMNLPGPWIELYEGFRKECTFIITMTVCLYQRPWITIVT